MSADLHDMPAIQGAGGKGGGRAAVEDKDSLRSTQSAEVLDLLSEGEIQGLVNGLKSVYLDGVPLENADGSSNFQGGAQFFFTPGTQGQAALPGFDSVQNEVPVGVNVPLATPVVRTISNSAVDQVRVTIGVPTLTFQDSATGDLKGTEFTYAIDVQSAGGGFVEKVRDTIKGKTTSAYSRAKKIQLTGSAPWDVRVRRISADATNSSTQNAFNWSSYTEIQSLRLRYPNSALAALRVSAKQFARVPTRAYDVMGLRIQVPTNYNPITRVYSGVWDGTFKIAWSNNPAWIFREVATHPRWGLGRFISPAQVNKWYLYKIAQYCDGLVGDGRGGQEPRFTCNVYFQTTEQARKVLQDLAAVFRSMAFWAGGELQVVQDAPDEVREIYDPSKVVDGAFEYQSGSDLKRHSVFIAYYNDLAQLGKRMPEVYTDDALVARYGIQVLELSPIGTTSRGQAHRLARWAAYTEAMEGETVSFKVGSEGALVLPGQLFEVRDPNEAGERLGGRVSSATAAAVTLDAPVTLRPGETYVLRVQFPDAAVPNKYTTQERALTTAAGTVSVLNVSPAFTAAPAPQTAWGLSSNVVNATLWRCLAVAEVAGKDQFELAGVSHNAGKFALIEQGISLPLRPISRVSTVPAKPLSLLFTETPYRVGSAYRSRVTLSWAEGARGLLYMVSWRLNSGPWTDMAQTSANCVDVDGLARGALQVVVKSVNALGNASAALEGNFTLLGKTAKPPDVAAFTATVVQGGVRFTWTANPDDDYLITTLKIGAAILFEGAASSWTWPWPAQGSYTVSATHWDTSLGESATPAPVTVVVDASVLVGWAGLGGRPLDTTNMLLTPTFESGSVGDWGSGSAVAVSGQAWTKALQSPARDTVASTRIPVRAGETMYTAADLDASATPFPMYLVMVCYNAADAQIDSFAATLQVPAGTGWTRVTGSGVVPANTAYVLADIVCLGTAGFGSPRAANLYFGRHQPGATRNRSYRQFADPAVSPGGIGDGDEWLQTDAGGSTLMALFRRVAGAWVSAPANFSLVPRGKCVASGSAVQKIGGAPAWDSDAYSLEAYTGGAFCSFQAGQTNAAFMSGLNADPGTDGSYTSMDYALYATASGTVEIYESGDLKGSFGAYTTSTSFAVTYDGTFVRYLVDGVVIRSVPAATGLKLFFDSSFYSPGGAAKAIKFGPLTDISGVVAAAASAASAASAAQTSANSALTQLTDIASDDILSPVEKPRIVQDTNVIATEQSGIDSQATNYAVTTEKTAYDAAVSALSAYLSTLTTPYIWSSLSGNTAIVGTTFRSKFADVYTTRQAVLDKISANAKARLGALATLNVVGTAEIAPEAATSVYNYKLGATTTAVQTLFVFTPPVSCAVEFTATFTAENVLPDSANYCDLTVQPAGSAKTYFSISGALNTTRKAYTAVSTLQAVGGVELTFRLEPKTNSGNPVVTVYQAEARAAVLKR